MTSAEVLLALKDAGQESIKKVLLKHNIKEPLYGVKIEELKKIQKKIKMDHALALELYDTGIYDARYLAGLIAEPEKMSQSELQKWVTDANAPVLSECTVAWVASESPHAMEMARKWIESPDEGIASSGWATLSSLASIKEDKDLDISVLNQLLERVVLQIHSSPNNVRSAMNNFVIAMGTHVLALNEPAKSAARKMGVVMVDKGDTACKVPSALQYIEKAESKNAIGKKRKTARC